MQVLELRLVKSRPDTAEIVVEIVNAGSIPVAVCPCLGPPHRFIVFDLYSVNQMQQLPYPEMLFEGGGLRRFYECLQPGESVAIDVDLSNWQPIWGNLRDDSLVLNLLGTAGLYRARARYIDSGTRGWRQCKGFKGELRSQWLSLEVSHENLQDRRGDRVSYPIDGVTDAGGGYESSHRSLRRTGTNRGSRGAWSETRATQPGGEV